MDRQMDKAYSALLNYDWVLDLDATIKPLSCRQEEARVGYNPMKPRRPSHAYQAMVFAAAKAGWREAGQGWEGVECELQLQGWSRARRVIVLRRKVRERGESPETAGGQPRLPGLVVEHKC
jgi:hypothetical protein